MRPCGKRGFTLIELLVVIAIIAILAAILFPVFAKARDRAKLSACLSNQKQLAHAFLMYADDNDGYMPFGISFADGAGRPGIEEYKDGYRKLKYSLFYRYTLPYVKNDQIYQCPSDRSALQNTVHKTDEVTYRFNCYASGAWEQGHTDTVVRITNPNGPFRPLSITQCKRPSEYALMRERFTDNHWKLTAQEEANGVDYSKRRSPVAMADGSAKMIPGQAPAGQSPWLGITGCFMWTGNELPS